MGSIQKNMTASKHQNNYTRFTSKLIGRRWMDFKKLDLGSKNQQVNLFHKSVFN